MNTSTAPRSPQPSGLPQTGPAPAQAKVAHERRPSGISLVRSPTAWILFYLLTIDLGVNLLFHYPVDPTNTSPSRLQQYFEYGRSVEGKLSRMTRGTDRDSAPIVAAGWLAADAETLEAPGDGRARPVVTIYGMSHAHLLAKELARIDARLLVRSRAAPLATPTWTHAAYTRDKARARSDVVIFTVMTRTITLLSATSGGTMYFDGSYPYTWPRYSLDSGMLRPIAPPFDSVDAYRAFFFDETRWDMYRSWLATHDPYYDSLLFRRTFLDSSCLVRLLRRSYALASRAARQSAVYREGRGFNATSEEVKILKAIVADFGVSARRQGSIPIVFIVNNLNTSDHAFAALKPTLDESAIPYLSSHEVCPPDDPRYYLPDSHFVPSKNHELARAMADLVRRQLGGR